MEIAHELRGQVDLVVGGGILVNEPSTVIDLSEDTPVLVRAGKGDSAVMELLS